MAVGGVPKHRASRQQVDQLRRTPSISDNPLTDAQSARLVTAFAAEHKRADREPRDWPTSSAAIESPDLMQETVQRAVDAQSRLVAVAAPILDSTQRERHKQQVDQQVSILRATMSMMRSGNQP